MKKNKLLLLLIIISCFGAKAQSVYIDPTVNLALRSNGSLLENQQKKTNDEIKELNRTQTMVQGLLFGINQTQRQVHRGLTEVNGVVTSGNRLRKSYINLTKAFEYSEEALRLAGRDPHHLILATSQMDRVRKWSIELYADIASIITASPNNLMTSGDRNELLYKIERDTYHLYISAIVLVQQLKRIRRVGFLNAMNPFSRGFRNRDVEIFTNMMQENGIQY